jgi:hypothetical protein
VFGHKAVSPPEKVHLLPREPYALGELQRAQLELQRMFDITSEPAVLRTGKAALGWINKLRVEREVRLMPISGASLQG